MADIDDFLAYVSPEVEGCPRNIMIRELTGAAIRFCRESHYIRKSQTIPLVAGQRSYALDLGAGWEVVRALGVKFGARGVEFKGTDYLDENVYGWEAHDASEPLLCYLDSVASISTYPLMNSEVAGSIAVKVAAKPSRASLLWVDEIHEDYVEVIAHGAKSKLMMIKSGDWYDPKQAGFCASEFKQGYLEAKREVFKGFSNETLESDPVTMGV